MLRPGNAGSNTAAGPQDGASPERSNSLPSPAMPGPPGVTRARPPSRSLRLGGATHEFAKACREMGVVFSFGFPVTAEMRGGDHLALPLELASGDRGGRHEASGRLRLPKVRADRPEALAGRAPRVIVRKEHLQPGVPTQASSTRSRAFRHTAFICAPRDAREKRAPPHGRLVSSATASTPGRGPHPPREGGRAEEPALR